MKKKQSTIDGILYEISRTLDYIRHDPSFPEAHDYMATATGFFKAKPVGRFMDIDGVEWKGGKMPVVGGDWYELPSLLLDLTKLLATTHGPVKSFTGQFSPQDVLTLQAKGRGGVLCEWSFEYKPREQHESPELLEQADDVSGIPECIVGALRSLNNWLRKDLYPLKPKAEIPVKFWRIADPAVQWSALQYLYGELLKPFDYDAAAVPPLPPGYATVCTIFHMFEQADNEGLETAIENLGWGYLDPLVAEFDRVGLPNLGELCRKAWLTHPEGAKPNARAFKTVAAKLGEQIDDDEETLEAIFRYVSANGRLFELADNT